MISKYRTIAYASRVHHFVEIIDLWRAYYPTAKFFVEYNKVLGISTWILKTDLGILHN